MARSRSPSRSLARQTWPVGPFAGGSRRGRPAQGRAAGRGAAFAEPAVARASTAAPAPAAAVVGLVRLRPPQPVSSAHSPCRYPPFSRPFLRRSSTVSHRVSRSCPQPGVGGWRLRQPASAGWLRSGSRGGGADGWPARWRRKRRWRRRWRSWRRTAAPVAPAAAAAVARASTAGRAGVGRRRRHGEIFD